MFHTILALILGSVTAMIGYAIGAYFTDSLIWSLLFAGPAFLVGFMGWLSLVSWSGARDETHEPT